ncbi:hypothetical protein [Flavobacterium sp.]
MKTITRKSFFLPLLFLALAANAQDNLISDKTKFGFSTLKFNNVEPIEGNVFQFDLTVSNRISKMLSIEYGPRFSSFRANYYDANSHRSVEYQTIGLPVNLVFSKNLNSNVSFSYAFGAYGNYLYKARIGTEVDKNNIGFNFGLGLQAGVILKVTETAGFGIMFDLQTDLNRIEKKDMEFKQTNTSLISLVFHHKL